MEPRLSLVTLGVSNLDRSRSFYCDVLGWKPARQSVGDVVFFQAGGVVLALYPRALLAEDARVADAGGREFGGFTLAHNVPGREDVDRVLAEVARRGARILRPAEDAFWGGRMGYFADPDGNPWEVAWNPGFPMDAEGTVRLEGPPRKARAGAASAAAQRKARRGGGGGARRSTRRKRPAAG
jgi:catechol 2,3-dioxygenase-like lactoylglutathione lyase family enzyme